MVTSNLKIITSIKYLWGGGRKNHRFKLQGEHYRVDGGRLGFLSQLKKIEN